MSQAFAQQLLKIALSQIIKDAGFEQSSTNCTLLLVDVFERYLCLLGETCQQYSNHSDHTKTTTNDLYTTFIHFNINPRDLQVFWLKWGIRLPKPKESKEKRSKAGNAILDALLSNSKTEETVQLDLKEKSGFFRMEPASFPLDMDQLYQKEYTPKNIQEVPESVLETVLKPDIDEDEKSNLYQNPQSFAESQYYQGDFNFYSEPFSIEAPKKVVRDKIMSKSRKLFEKAFHSCLEIQAPSDPSNMILTPQHIERLMIDRLSFNVSIPQITMYPHTPDLGLINDFYNSSLGTIIPGIRKQLPAYKEDQRELRKEQRAMEAARAERMQLENASIASFNLSIPDSNSLQNLNPSSNISFAESFQTRPSTQDLNAPSPKEIDISLQILEAVQAQQKQEQQAPKLKLKFNTQSPSKPSPLKLTFTAPSQQFVNMAEIKSPEEQIRCICANTTTDYGLFMVACDACGIWFHGECVDVQENSIPEGGTWLCYQCDSDEDSE